MNQINIKPIGKVISQYGQFAIQLDEAYKQALLGLDGHSHILVLWWSHLLDRPDLRSQTILDKPYSKGPANLGIFATRSPMRPNPICVSIASLISVDQAAGRIELGYVDAENDTPVLDIKPYLPCADRVAQVTTPAWNHHWPTSYEESGNFAWEKEFTTG
jgi:tRNA (adenine37-N6)-methyltransferase